MEKVDPKVPYVTLIVHSNWTALDQKSVTPYPRKENPIWLPNTHGYTFIANNS